MDAVCRRIVLLLLLLCTVAENVAAESEPAFPAITRFTVGQDSPGIMTSAALDAGAKPTLFCSVQSGSRPVAVTLRRERDGKVLTAMMDVDLTFTFEPLLCEDTGFYVCSVHNRAGVRTARLNLTVLCRPQLITDHRPGGADSPFYIGAVGSDLTVQLDILGSPPPARLLLTTANTDTALASRDLRGGGDGDVDYHLERFQFEYVPAARPHGTVELLIKSLTKDDMGKIFCLVVENEKRERMNYVFMVTEAPDTETPPATTAGSSSSLPPPPSPPSSLPPSPPSSLPPSPPSSLNIPALALGLALAVVDVAIIGVVVWIVCHRCATHNNRFKTMMQEREMARRQRRVLRNEKPRPSETTVSQPSSMALSEFQTYELSTYNSQNTGLSEQTIPTHQQQPRLSQDGDDRFSKDLQPEGALRHSQGQSHHGIENIYFSPDADEDDGGVSSKIEYQYRETGDLHVLRNSPTDVGNSDKELTDLAPVEKDRKKANRISTMYAKVHKRKRSAKKKLDTPSRSEESTLPTDGECYYAKPRPDDEMRAAEQHIANGESATEFVVLGQHRKLSLPKDGLNVYQNF